MGRRRQGRPGARAPRCDRCGRAYAEIELEVGGRRLRMLSCSNCDDRRWVDENGELDLDGVLTAVNDASAA